MSGEQDWNKKSVKILTRKDGNTKCADCGEPDPQWASCTLGVFLCVNCCGIHRKIPEISKVKSLNMAKWEDDQIQFLDRNGNDSAKAIYEAYVPVYYYRPTHLDYQDWNNPLDPLLAKSPFTRNAIMIHYHLLDFRGGHRIFRGGPCVLREQWIRAKYERKQFLKKEISDGISGKKEGNLYKRGRDNGQYCIRKFVLTELDGTLKYFTKPDAKEPKAVIKIDTINATFQPEKMKHDNGLQITYVKDNKTRNIFVYHNDGQEIVSWFNAIRAAQFHYMKVAFPTANDKEIVSHLPRNFLKEGYMEKTGPKPTDGFKRRWFTLDHRRLMYFKDPLDAFAKGEVFLGNSSNGYQVKAEMVTSNVWSYGISVSTPDRTYLFTCESEVEQDNWLKVFKKVISLPMTMREYAVEAQFKHRS